MTPQRAIVRWLSISMVAGAAAIMLEGILADMLRRFVPDYVLFYEPFHGGEVVGNAAGIAVVLILCAVAVARTLRIGTTSPVWMSVVWVELLRFGAGLAVLAWLLTDARFQEALPSSLPAFLVSAFVWWPVLFLASLAASFVLVRRLPRPAVLQAACVAAGAALAVLLLWVVFERTTLPLYYLRQLKGL